MKMFYYYLYYQCFLFIEKINKPGDDKEYSAMILVSVFVSVNFFTVIIFLNKVLSLKLTIMALPIILFPMTCFANYKILYSKGKYDKILNYFKKNRPKVIWKTFFLLYVLLTIFLCVIEFYLFRQG